MNVHPNLRSAFFPLAIYKISPWGLAGDFNGKQERVTAREAGILHIMLLDGTVVSCSDVVILPTLGVLCCLVNRLGLRVSVFDLYPCCVLVMHFRFDQAPHEVFFGWLLLVVLKNPARALLVLNFM